MRILCITRSYPPIVGGLEQASYYLTTHLLKLVSGQIIANRKGHINIPFFLPYALVKALQIIRRERIDLAHLGDALLAPLGAALKTITGVKVVCTTHGLDVIHDKFGYQHIIPPWLPKLDHIICVSRATRQACLERRINPQRCTVIPNGINPDKFQAIPKADSRRQLEQILGIKLAGEKVLLSVGHLVKRKGFSWFIESVLPKLDDHTFYIAIGNHKDNLTLLRDRVNELSLNSRVCLPGLVDDTVLNLAYHAADLMVMPNIPVTGDIEGFGIVGLEASCCGLPVLASDLEGVRDAVQPGENGFLVPPLDAEAYINLIERFEPDAGFSAKVKQFTLTNFTWDKIAQDYVNLFRKVVAS